MKRPQDHRPKQAGRHMAVDHRGRVTALVADGEPGDQPPVPTGDEPVDDELKDLSEAELAELAQWAAAVEDERTRSLSNAPSGATVRRTAISSPEQLADKIAHLRAHAAATPEVERMDVSVVTASGEVSVPMAVRWDEDAFDPFKWDNERRAYGAKGAFVSTLSTILDLTAAGADLPQIVDDPGAAWHAVLCVEGLRSDEDISREIVPGACQFPDLPVSLRLQIHDEGGHYGAVTCGRIDTMERQDMSGYGAIAGTGLFGTDEHGQTAQLLVDEQTQRFVSIDARNADIEIIEITVATGDPWDDDDMDQVVDWWMRFNSLTIGAATIVARPALMQAVIALASADLPETPIAVATAQSQGIVTVTADGGPLEPDKAWFDDPGFHVGDPRLVRQPDGKYACPLTVEPNGRLFGHVCYWGQRHTAVGRTPPRSMADLAHYLTGPGVKCQDGSTVHGIGQITMGCGHASTGLGYAPAKAHYDGGYGAKQVADVRAGQDDFGVWIAGSLRSDLSAEELRAFTATNLSGDWRRIAGSLELIAVLAGVPVQGYPIARHESLVAAGQPDWTFEDATRTGLRDGEMVSLVAAGVVRRRSVEERLAMHESFLDELLVDFRQRKTADALASLDSLLSV